MEFLNYLREKPLRSLLIGVGMLLLGTVMFKLPRAIVSSNWPTTEGEIVSSYVEVGDHGDSWSAWPRVSYTYLVDGKKYTSNNIEVEDFGRATDSYAQKVIQRYPEGARVKVFYEPDDPAVAVLEPGFPRSSGFVFIFLLVVIMGIGVISLCIGLYGIAVDWQLKTFLISKSRGTE